MDDRSGTLGLTRRQILGGLGVVGAGAALGGTGTSAFYSDTERFQNNQLVAGELDLVVSWDEHYYNGSAGAEYVTDEGYPMPTMVDPMVDVLEANLTDFQDATRLEQFPDGGLSMEDDPCEVLVNAPDDLPGPVIEIDDVKPGDFGEVTFDFSLCTNPGYVWLTAPDVDAETDGVQPYVADEGGLTEAEIKDEDEDQTYDENGTVVLKDPENDPDGPTVELLDAIQAAVWVDDGNNYQNEPEVPRLSGSLREVLSVLTAGKGFLLMGDQGENPQFYRCFSGAPSVHYVAFAWWLPVDHANEIQTDSVTFNLGFYTEQCRHNVDPIQATDSIVANVVGGSLHCVEPIQGGEPIDEYYTSADIPNHNSDIDFTAADTSFVFLYEDGDGALSLVMVHDVIGDDSGGEVDFAFEWYGTDGLDWTWLVQDEAPEDNGFNDVYHGIDAVEWNWNPGWTDGGAIGPLTHPFEVVINPEFRDGIDTWILLDGSGEDLQLPLDRPLRLNSQLDCGDI